MEEIEKLVAECDQQIAAIGKSLVESSPILQAWIGKKQGLEQVLEMLAKEGEECSDLESEKSSEESPQSEE